MTIASIKPGSAVSEIVTSCGRTSLPSTVLTGPEETHHERTGRVVVDLAGRANLLDPGVVHHRDGVGDLHRLLLIVRHQDGGHALLVVQPPQPAPELGPHVGIERAERLVEQQHLRLDRQRPGQGHALTLPARELVGPLLGPLREPDQGQQLLDAGAHLGRLALADLEAEGHVVEHGHVRERGVVLEHEADAAILGTRPGDVPVRDPDDALVGRLQAGDDPQQRRLARAARTEQRGQRALGNLERDVFERDEVPEPLGDAFYVDPHRASFVLEPNIVISSSTAIESTANSVAAAYTLVVT